MRKRIYEIIEKSDGNDIWSSVYDYVMIVTIIISLIPLAFKHEIALMKWTDEITAGIFIIDYFLRLSTADFKYENHSIRSFLRYPFSFMAMVDLISILPSLSIVNQGFKVLRIVRMLRAMRVVRVFKAMRYSKSFEMIGRVFKASKDSLIAVCALTFGYILISALIIYNVEPDSFHTFFEAVYWATISLTTVGYGDIYPVTAIGRGITMISSVFGIAIIALPSSIITAGYMREIREEQDRDEDDKEKEK